MNNRFDKLLQNGTLKIKKASRGLDQFLGIVMATQVALMLLTIAGLSSCMASVPSTFPEIQVPSPSTALPGPPSTSQPSGSGMPQPTSGGGLPSPPSPSLPSPGSPSSGTPSLPQPPSPMPSPDSSNGNPSMPSIPSPSGQDNPESGGSDGGTTTPDSNSSGGGGGQGSGNPAGDGMDVPQGDTTFPGGDQDGQPDGDQSSDSGGTMLPGDEGSAGGGWETSNQLPDPNAGDEEEEGGTEEGEDDIDSTVGTDEDELQQVLGDLDGEILSERNAANARANDDIAESGSMETNPEESGTGTADDGVQSGVVISDEDHETGRGGGEDDELQIPDTQESAKDTPDARDEQVVARQMREAAIAEEDPELKEKLWEEYEDYVDGLK